MTRRVHFLAIAGRSATELEAACERVLELRVEDQPGVYSYWDWTEEDGAYTSALAQSLLDSAHELPVIHYSQFIDPWAMSDYQLGLVDWPDKRRRQISSLGRGLAFYPSRHTENLLVTIKRLQRRKRLSHASRCYTEHLRGALQSTNWLHANAIVIVISECAGPSREDDDIRASLEVSLPLPAVCQRLPPGPRPSRHNFKDALHAIAERVGAVDPVPAIESQTLPGLPRLAIDSVNGDGPA